MEGSLGLVWLLISGAKDVFGGGGEEKKLRPLTTGLNSLWGKVIYLHVYKLLI